MVGNHDVNDTDWTTFKFSQLVPDDLVEFLIWLEPNDDNAADIYIDEVLIVEMGDVDDVDKSGLYFDFEDRDLNGWVARNGTDAIEVTDEANHTEGGSYSLLTEASEQYQGPLLDIEGKMAPGHIYDLSVWVKMKAGVEPTLIRMSLQLGSSGPYENITTDTLVTDAEWVELSTRYTMETYSELLYVYVELVDETDEPKPFYIDDFELKYVGAVS